MDLVLGVPLISVASLFLLKILLDIINKKISTISFMFIVFYIFYIIPLIISIFNADIFYKFYRYNDSFYNESSVFLSNLINITVLIFFICTYKTYNININININKNSRIIKYLSRFSFVGAALFLIILIFFSPNPVVYLEYGAVIADYDPILKEYHANVAMFCRLLIFLAAVSFLFVDKSKYGYIFYIIVAFIACWIGSKRSFVAYSLLILLLSMFFSYKVSSKRILITSILSSFMFVGYTNFYQTNVRDFDEKSDKEKIENIIIDYSRLQNERYVLYNMINGNEILPFAGASMLYNLAFFVPRPIWSSKPYPYAVYYTNHYFNIDDVDERLKWGLTTGLLDELIANFYWLGVFIYFLIIHLFVKYNDKYLNGFSGLVGIVLGCLMLILHFAAYSYIFIFWIILNLYNLRKKRV